MKITALLGCWALALTVCVVSNDGKAAEKEWQFSTVGSWEAGGSWNPSGRPTPDDDAIVDRGEAQISTQDACAHTLTLGQTGGSFGTVLLDSNRRLSVSTNLVVGGAGAGSFAHNSGTVHMSNGYSICLGSLAGGQGYYQMTEGSIFVAGGVGLVVGKQGNGTFVQTAGTSHFPSCLEVGWYGNSTGLVNLSGGFMRISGGDGDEDSLLAGDPCSVDPNDANTVATFLMSDSDSGTEFDWNYTLYVGCSGSASFHQTGGSAHGHYLRIGEQETGNGIYVLEGGTLIPSGRSVIGTAGLGVLEICGGTFNPQEEVLVGGFPPDDGRGLVAMSSGRFDTDSNVYVGSYGTGTFTLSGGTFNSSSNVYVGNGEQGMVSITGGVFLSDAMYAGISADSNVHLLIGKSADITFNDPNGLWLPIDESQGIALLSIDLASLQDYSEVPRFAHLGTVNSLDVQCGAYRPRQGQQFAIFLNGASGTFATVTSNFAEGLGSLKPPFTQSNGTIYFNGLTKGDCNGDGVVGPDGNVDTGDLSILGSNWNKTVGDPGDANNWFKGDFNGDGLVGTGDLSLMGGNWGYCAPDYPDRWNGSGGDSLEGESQDHDTRLLPELTDRNGDGVFDIKDVYIILEECGYVQDSEGNWVREPADDQQGSRTVKPGAALATIGPWCLCLLPMCLIRRKRRG